MPLRGRAEKLRVKVPVGKLVNWQCVLRVSRASLGTWANLFRPSAVAGGGAAAILFLIYRARPPAHAASSPPHSAKREVSPVLPGALISTRAVRAEGVGSIADAEI